MPKTLNIFHHSSDLGGASKSLLILCDALSSIFDIHIYLGKQGSGWLFHELENRNLKYTSLDSLIALRYVNGSYLTPFLRAFQFLHLKKKLNSEFHKIRNCDLAIYNSITLIVAANIFLTKSNKNIIFQRETFSKLSNYTCPNGYLKYLNLLDGVIHISDYDRSRLKINTRQFVIPNIPEEDVEPTYDHKNQLFFAGGYNRIKGLKFFLKTILKEKLNIPFVLNIPNPHTQKRVFSFKLFVRVITLSDYEGQCRKLLKRLDQKLVEYHEGNAIPWSKFSVLLIWPTTPHQLRLIRECYQQSKVIICPDYENYQEFIEESNTILFNNAGDLGKILNRFNKKLPIPRSPKKFRYCPRQYKTELLKAINETMDIIY